MNDPVSFYELFTTVFKYYPKDNEYRLIETIELEEALKIESIFNEIGYFSVSAYVKSKL